MTTIKLDQDLVNKEATAAQQTTPPPPNTGAHNSVVENEEPKNSAEPQDLTNFMGFDSLDEALDAYEYTSQAEALARMFSRENIYIAGGAGSGKSSVVNKFIYEMGLHFGSSVNIAVTATTGKAATSIGGRTIHSWSGIGIDTQVSRVPESVVNTDVLIVDEISMLPAYYLDLVDEVCKRAKRSKKPFGGIQVIFSGDFLQLPPVPNKQIDKDFDQRYVIFSEAWQDAHIKSCFLDKSMRSTDPLLTRILHDMENGTVSQDTVDLLRPQMKSRVEKRMGGQIDETEKTYTKLYTVNKRVDEENEKELLKNPHPAQTFYNSVERVGGTDEEYQEMSKTVKIPDSITVKPEAKVMIIKNGYYPEANIPFSYHSHQDILANTKNIKPGMDKYVSNGTVGKVVATINTQQSSNFFLVGSALVKLNDNSVIIVRLNVQEKNKFKTVGKTEDGKPITQKVQILSVKQMPLILAWATSVHKSQGQTLDGVIADLSQCFVDGMGYVALSRVRTLDSIIIEKINRKAFRMNADSRRINKALKKSAKENREEFLQDRDVYENVLISGNARKPIWQDIIDSKSVDV